MAVQFGIATLELGGKNIGIIQGVTMDFAFDQANLFAGGSAYAVDVRPHTGTIQGNAEFADIDGQTIQKIIGGTLAGDVLTISNTSFPGTFQLVLRLSTDGIPLVVTLIKVRSTKLALAMSRDSHVIPNFDFAAEANDAGQVATLDLGDIS